MCPGACVLAPGACALARARCIPRSLSGLRPARRGAGLAQMQPAPAGVLAWTLCTRSMRPSAHCHLDPQVHRVGMIQRPHLFLEPTGPRSGFIPAAGPATVDKVYYADA